MGVGLGTMQRAILAALEPAKAAHQACDLDYRGGCTRPNIFMMEYAQQEGQPPPRARIRQRGRTFVPPSDAYDLRAALAYLAGQAGRRRALANGYEIEHAFRVSFSRAVRGLIWRGELVNLDRGWSREARLVARANPAPDGQPSPSVPVAVFQ